MKTHSRLLIAILLTLAAVPSLAWHTGSAQNNQQEARGKGQEKFRKSKKPVREQYIVVLNSETPADEVEPLANEFLGKHGGTTRHIYKHAIKGFSIQLPEPAAMALSRDPRVAYVEEDTEATLNRTISTSSWSLTRIDQRTNIGNSYYLSNVEEGTGVHAYILDTGIKAGHHQFGTGSFNRASADADFVWWNYTNGNDCDGHGTSVASILGGFFFGSAKDVRLHGVRIGDCIGFTTASTIVAGVDWVTANHVKPALVNMSMGIPADPVFSTSVEDAIRRSIAQGITYVVSAGNGPTDVNGTVPARMPEVITVGASTETDSMASFSNFGPGVDLFAPGVNMQTASIIDHNGNGIPDDVTGPMEGTSLSAPLVAGVVARFLNIVPNAAPAAVQGALLNSATLNVLSNLGPGSPNRLLFSEVRHGFLGQQIRSIGEGSTNVDSGVFLNPGQWLAMSGIGEIWAGVPFTSNNGPQGWNTFQTDSSFPLPGSRPYSLIGRLENSSQNFYIGTSNAITDVVSSPTRMFLRTNDNFPGDGTGAFLCKTELWKVLPDSRADFWSNISVPSAVLAGDTWPVWIELENVGKTTWTAGQGFKLAAQGDNMTWGINRVTLPHDVPPGATVRFAFNIIAPTVPGTYTFPRWRMIQEGVQRFGDATPSVQIAVLSRSNAAQFVSQVVPGMMYATESYTVSVTMRNIGNTIWTAGAGYKLGSQNLQDNTTWGWSRVPLPRDIWPGQEVTFTFEVMAPLKTGNTNFQWRMVQEGVEWFGDFTPNKVVSVKPHPCPSC